MSILQVYGPNNRPLNEKGNPVALQSLPEHAGKFNPSTFKHHEVEKALNSVSRSHIYRTDPFARARAFNLMQRGIYRPQDILEGVSI